MNVWQVNNDVRNECLALVDELQAGELLKLKGTPLSSTWQPLKVFLFREQGQRPVDFPGISAELVASVKAVNAISGLIKDHAELLPLETSHDRYFIINVTDVVPCLDHAQSNFEYYKSGTIKRIRKLVFELGCIGNRPIFKIPERLRGTVFVTDAFKRVVEENALTGLIFTKVWGD